MLIFVWPAGKGWEPLDQQSMQANSGTRNDGTVEGEQSSALAGNSDELEGTSRQAQDIMEEPEASSSLAGTPT